MNIADMDEVFHVKVLDIVDSKGISHPNMVCDPLNTNVNNICTFRSLSIP